MQSSWATDRRARKKREECFVKANLEQKALLRRGCLGGSEGLRGALSQAAAVGLGQSTHRGPWPQAGRRTLWRAGPQRTAAVVHSSEVNPG